MVDETPELPEAKVLRLQPGDIIVLQTNLTTAEAVALSERVKARFPQHENLILSGGLALGSTAPEEMLDSWADALWPRLRERMLNAARSATWVGLA